MDKNTNGVETKVDNAPTTEAIKTTDVEVAPTQEIDYKKLAFDLLDENKKISEDRDNYRQGLLSAKKGTETPENILELKKSLDNLTDLVETVTKENKEIKIALSNRNQILNAPIGGAGEDKSKEVKDKFFTDEQLKFLQKKGLNPETVKSNMLKAKEAQKV